jgi:hypothetical protein
MLLNLKTSIKELDGKDSETLTVGKALANIVLMIKSDPLRSYLMAQKLYVDNDMELSTADFEWIKTAVTEHGKEVYGNNLVIGQLLLILSELKDSK